MGLGEILALCCALAWASAIVLFKYSGNVLSANTLNLVKNCIGFAWLLPTALLMEGLQMPSLSTAQWLIVAASGYFGIAIADTLYLQALRDIGAGRTAIAGSMYSPFVVLLSVVFLSEHLALWQWLGFALVILGIMVMVAQSHYERVARAQLYKGVGLAILSVFLTAAGVVAMKPILAHDGFFWIVCLRMLAGLLGMLILATFMRQWAQIAASLAQDSVPWRIIFVASTMGTFIAMLFWLGGFKFTSASIASVLNEMSNVFIVLMAWLFLRESLGWQKILGISLCFVGVTLFLGLFGT